MIVWSITARNMMAYNRIANISQWNSTIIITKTLYDYEDDDDDDDAVQYAK